MPWMRFTPGTREADSKHKLELTCVRQLEIFAWALTTSQQDDAKKWLGTVAKDSMIKLESIVPASRLKPRRQRSRSSARMTRSPPVICGREGADEHLQVWKGSTAFVVRSGLGA